MTSNYKLHYVTLLRVCEEMIFGRQKRMFWMR